MDNGGTMIVVGIAVFVGTLIIHAWGFVPLFVTMFLIQLTSALIQTRLFFKKRARAV